MAEAGLDLGSLWEPYVRNGRTYIRVRHDQTRSARLEAFRVCVGDHVRGSRFRTGDPAADEAAVRAAFREAAQECRADTGRLERRTAAACAEADRLAQRLEELSARRQAADPQQAIRIGEQEDATYRLFQAAHERCLAEGR